MKDDKKTFMEPKTEYVEFQEEVVSSSGCPCKGINCKVVCTNQCSTVGDVCTRVE